MSRLRCTVQMMVVGLVAMALVGCETTPEVPLNMAQPDPDQIQRVDEGAAAPLDELDSDVVLARAEGFRKIGKANEALFYYVTYLEREPQNPAALTAVGQIHLEKKNLDLARTALEMSLERAPENATTLESLGVIALKQKDWLGANTYLQNALKLNPKAPRTLTSLGLLADQKGDYSKAQDFYREAMALDPRSPGIRNNLAYSFYLKSNYTLALKTADEALQLAPSHEGLRMNRSLFLMKLDRPDQAFLNFRQFLSEPDACNNMGYLYLQAGDYSRARHYLELAVHASPSYHELAHQNLKKLAQIEDRQLNVEDALAMADHSR